METIKKKSLFWDTETPDLKKNQDFVIERVLNFGDVDDFKWLKKTYKEEAIKKVVRKNRSLNRKSFSFWCQYFKINKSKCSQGQSATKQKVFWKK